MKTANSFLCHKVLSIVLATSGADAQVPFHSSSFHYEHLDNLRVSWKWWSSSYFCQSLQLKINHPKKKWRKNTPPPPAPPEKKWVVSPAEEAGSEIWPHQSNEVLSILFNNSFVGIPPTLLAKNGQWFWVRQVWILAKGSMKYILPPSNTMVPSWGTLSGSRYPLRNKHPGASQIFAKFHSPPNLSGFGNTFQQSSYIVRSLPHLSCQISYKNRWFPTFKCQIICYSHGLPKPPECLQYSRHKSRHSAVCRNRF